MGKDEEARPETKGQEVPIAIQAELIGQEHRTFHVLWNYVRTRKIDPQEKDPRREAASRALLWRIVAPSNVVVASVGVTAVLSLVLAWRANDLVADQVRQQRAATELDRHYRARERMDELVNTLYARSDCEGSGKERNWCSADDVAGVGDCGPSSSLAARRRAAHEILWLTWKEEQEGTPIATRRQLAHALIAWFEAGRDDHLEGVSLMGADLRCAEFSNLSLNKMDFRWANLRYARIRSNPTDVNWQNATCPDGTVADERTGCATRLGTPHDWDRWQNSECRSLTQTSEPPFPCSTASKE